MVGKKKNKNKRGLSTSRQSVMDARCSQKNVFIGVEWS